MKPESLKFEMTANRAYIMRDGQADALATLAGQSRDVERFGRLFAAAPAMLAALQRIAQGGNVVHSDLPHATPKTRDELAQVAREVLDVIGTAARGSFNVPAASRAAGLAVAMQIVGDMRQSEAGLMDAAHSGQRGEDRSTALYDAYHAIRKAAEMTGHLEGDGQ